MKKLYAVVNFPFILIVQTYQFFSPLKQFLLGPYARCRFYPTCSEYSLECFRRFPLHQAVLKSFLRICRCNPSHPGGNDPVLSEDTQPDQKICSK